MTSTTLNLSAGLTPLMQQYNEIKARHSDALLLFRMGDFYELFGPDAVEAARILDVALTTRNKNDPKAPPMCGVPHHALPHYLPKLVAAGKKVAICEQLENPAEAKGIVKRDVVRIVSPGTQTDPEALDRTRPNITHAAEVLANERVAWASCDFSTGHFWFGESASLTEWEGFFRQLQPSEVLLAPSANNQRRLWVKERLPNAYVQEAPAFYFETQYGRQRLTEQFGAQHSDAIHPQLSQAPHLIGPCGALIKLYQETQKALRVPAVFQLHYWNERKHMALDAPTIGALDLLPSDRTRGHSLFEFIDSTQTAIGARTLREWLLHPLTEAASINKRQSLVKQLVVAVPLIAKQLSEIYDLERLLTRICNAAEFGTANARDLKALAVSLDSAERLADTLKTISADLSQRIRIGLPPALVQLAQDTVNALVAEPPLSTREGGMFVRGFNKELDELIDLTEKGEQWLVEYEQKLRDSTSINSLKVRFNRVFGYYIEVTKSNLKNVPDTFIRKQTMATAERYITPELKEFEDKILNAEKRRTDFEHALYRTQCGYFAEQARAIVSCSQAIAEVDSLQALAGLTNKDGFHFPAIHSGGELVIEDGFHPTVAVALRKAGQSFVRNSVELKAGTRRNKDGSAPSFLLITGPNMGGKSTVMRQTALIVLLAQLGAPVPAQRAVVGVVDRIFTRVGSADNLAEGQSTFMVEMSEMSFILRQATERSLILVDEIGRGTSTYDGLSLATAIAEFIVRHIGARTLFATHYHELTVLEQTLSGVKNARVGVRINQNSANEREVEFLFKLEPGASERSYGILVAKLAGLPENILMRAQTVLERHEKQHETIKQEAPIDLPPPRSIKTRAVAPSSQLGLF